MTTTARAVACAAVNPSVMTVTDDTGTEHYQHVAEQVTCDECARDEKRAMVMGLVLGVAAGAVAAWLIVRS
jgi:hypothetical protein